MLPIAGQPRIVVRNTVDGLAMEADPTSVFVGDAVELEISLLSGTDLGRALGNVVVNLTSSSDTSVLPASVTITDNMSGVKATFSDPTAGTVTITATAGNLTDEASVEVKSTISDLKVNDMDVDSAPVTVTGNERLTVTVVGQAGEANVRVVKKETDADDKEVVSSVVSRKGFDRDTDVKVSEGSVAYTRDFELPGLDEGSYTVEVTIAGEMAEINIEVVASREPVTALTLTASAENFFADESITVTVALDARAPIGGLKVTLSTDPADSGTFSMTEGGEAIPTVMIEDSADSMSAMVYYTNTTPGAVALMAAAGDDLEASVDVEVNPTISVQVNSMDEPEAVLPGATISVTATGKAGGGTVMVTDAEGEAVGSLTGLGLNVDADATDVPEGSVAYTRNVELPADIADGTYTVTVTIGSEAVPVEIEVMTPEIAPEPITAIAVKADPTSVFVGEDIEVSVTLWDADGEGEASAAMVINLSDGDAGGSFTDAEGTAITSITIPMEVSTRLRPIAMTAQATSR